MLSTLAVPLRITKCVLAIICSNSFSLCKGDQKKTVAISQMSNHAQLHVHWMHLLNTRICLHIYTPTVQTLHYCPAGAWHWNDVVLTSMWRHHVTSTSFWRHVPAGCDQDRCVKSCSTLKMKSTVFSKVYLYPRHLCRGVYSFRLDVCPFDVRSFVRSLLSVTFVEFTSKFLVKVSLS